jgi:hypothetical protein
MREISWGSEREVAVDGSVGSTNATGEVCADAIPTPADFALHDAPSGRQVAGDET